MPLDSRALFDFLEEVGRSLEFEIDLVAAGGTALTLLGIKASTIDVDFTGPKESIAALRAALKRTPHGFKVDTWSDGQVFTQMLPADYLKRSRRIKRIGRISLRALAPVDIVVTKAGRLDERDMSDIEACIRRFALTKQAIARRAQQVEYAANDRIYRDNVARVLDHFFAKR